MNKTIRFSRGLFIVLFGGTVIGAQKMPVRQEIHIPSSCYLDRTVVKKNRSQCYGHEAARFFGRSIQDMFYINLNLISWDSIKILCAAFPFYAAARMIDDAVQNCFYYRLHHKNINQPPDWCHDVAEWSIGVPIVLLGQNAFFSNDLDLRTTSRIFLLGMPFVIWSKDLIKNFEFDGCYRPWNEHFSCKKRTSGGFPSGHMAQATFAAVLYGMRFGPKYAVPLGALAAFVGTAFVVCNRHYISQIVAGAAFGAAYAVAANKVVSDRLAQDLKFNCSINRKGTVKAGLSYAF